ncbi:MAG: hypothetical protein H2042_18400 [Rhizobiales bacterium]|nr:hypothetical protein [Hyphomicrobiales bacterium]
MTRELELVAEDLRAGRQVEPITVRTFLGWFGAQRRGPNIVRWIRQELDETGLVTVPDFESRWIDATIFFYLNPETNRNISQDIIPPETTPDETVTWITRDATYRISKLAAANKEVARIAPDKQISEAVTLLLARDFSQLAVMTSDREVKGMISWRSIGARLAMGRQPGTVREFMEPHHEVRSEISIFDAIPTIIRNDYILVRDEQNKISGIVTSSDLSEQFHSLSEPFLILGEVENLIRNMIGANFSATELTNHISPEDSARSIAGVDDLTFGEYVIILQNPNNWQRLNTQIDRVMFCNDLNAIREIRNNITHFDPDGITSEEIEKLRSFKSFLQMMEIISR